MIGSRIKIVSANSQPGRPVLKRCLVVMLLILATGYFGWEFYKERIVRRYLKECARMSGREKPERRFIYNTRFVDIRGVTFMRYSYSLVDGDWWVPGVGGFPLDPIPGQEEAEPASTATEITWSASDGDDAKPFTDFIPYDPDTEIERNLWDDTISVSFEEAPFTMVLNVFHKWSRYDWMITSLSNELDGVTTSVDLDDVPQWIALEWVCENAGYAVLETPCELFWVVEKRSSSAEAGMEEHIRACRACSPPADADK